MENHIICHLVVKSVFESHAKILAIVERWFSDDCAGSVFSDIQGKKSGFLSVHLSSLDKFNTTDHHFSSIIDHDIVNFIAVPKLDQLKSPSVIGTGNDLDWPVQMSDCCSCIKSTVRFYDCWLCVTVMVVLKSRCKWNCVSFDWCNRDSIELFVTHKRGCDDKNVSHFPSICAFDLDGSCSFISKSCHSGPNCVWSSAIKLKFASDDKHLISSQLRTYCKPSCVFIAIELDDKLMSKWVGGSSDFYSTASSDPNVFCLNFNILLVLNNDVSTDVE